MNTPGMVLDQRARASNTIVNRSLQFISALLPDKFVRIDA